jgi:hypothetical protein
MLVYDIPRLDYKHFLHSGWCEARIYRHAGEVIAVASEVIQPDGEYASDGLSITNGIEAVAESIAAFTAQSFTLVEHDPARGYRLDLARQRGYSPQFGEDFALVTFQGPGFQRPEWRLISRRQVEELIGEPFPTLP